MNSVVERFQESAKQAAAFQKLLPRRIHISGAAEREQPQTSKASSSHRATQKQSVAYRAYRSDCTNTYKSRNQSREAGTSSRIFDSVETSAKYISLGPADYKKRVSDTVRVSPAQVHGGFVHRGGPPAGSGNGTRNKSSVGERGHRICTSLQQGNRILQPVFHSSKEGWRLASHLRPTSRGGKSTKIFYSSKSTITLLKFYLSTSKSTSLKIYSSKSKK